MKRDLANGWVQTPVDEGPVGWRAGKPLAFSAWHDEVVRWQASLAQLPGERIALHMADTLHFAAALFGAWHAGKAVVLTPDALPGTAAEMRSQQAALIGDWPHAVLREPGDDRAAGLGPLDEERTELFIFTSGSTGQPQAIPKRLRQLTAELEALESVFGAALGSASVGGSVSHQHIYGLLFRVLWPLASGRPIVAERAAYLEDLPQQALGSLALVASPAHLKRLQPVDLQPLAQRLVAVFSSGGPLPDEAVPTCLARLGQAPFEVFGSSESGGVAWRQRSQGDAWLPLPKVEWRIDGDALLLRSPHLQDDAWLRTEDKVVAHGVGFSLLGRADRIVKLEEKRLSLSGVERALALHPWVEEARALLLPSRRVELAVVLRLSPEGQVAWAEQGKVQAVASLRAHLGQQFEPGSLPRRWRQTLQWPSNVQGKTTEAMLAALFDAKRPPAHLVRASERAALYALTPVAGAAVFDGHFAEHPVLPGVVQLDWAERLAREVWPQLPAHFTGMEQLKFQQVISPGLALELQLDWDGAALIRFAFTSARGAHASGRLSFSHQALA